MALNVQAPASDPAAADPPAAPAPPLRARQSAALPAVGSGAALFVERDARYVLLRRRMLGTMTRGEWDDPAHRRAAIAQAWKAAIAGLRSQGLEFYTAAPVLLYRDPADGVVAYADIRERAEHRHRLIDPMGFDLILAPASPSGLPWVVEKTTYHHWAEGPLPHLDPELETAPTPTDDPDVQRLRHQNRWLRELVDRALSPANYAQQPRSIKPAAGLVDFRIRGVFKRRDFRVLESKQAGSEKMLTAEGVVDLSEGVDD